MKSVTRKRRKRSLTKGPGETRSTLTVRASPTVPEAVVEVAGPAVRKT